ncbi:putative protein kinase TKL-CTR1-DRK-2 family [Dioscorea sansibarensis]
MAEAERDALVKRFRDLEVSQARIREQLSVLLRETGGGGGEARRSVMVRGREEERSLIRGFFAGGPYGKVLQQMGHALHVYRPDTGEIIYWNQPAENIFGWKEYEAVGNCVTDLVIAEQSHAFFEKLIDRINKGHSWSGQFPLKKKSGEIFMALVTMSPLYEDGNFVGVITVSSEAAMFNDMNSDRARAFKEQANVRLREGNGNFVRDQWPSQTQTMSSVSNLASKMVFSSPAITDNEGGNSHERHDCTTEKRNPQPKENEKPATKTIFNFQAGRRVLEEKATKLEETLSKLNQRSNMAAKVFSKFQIRGSTSHGAAERSTQTNSAKFLVHNLIKKIIDTSEPNLTENSSSNGDSGTMSKEGICNLDQPCNETQKETQAEPSITSNSPGSSDRKIQSWVHSSSDRTLKSSDRSHFFESGNALFDGGNNSGNCHIKNPVGNESLVSCWLDYNKQSKTDRPCLSLPLLHEQNGNVDRVHHEQRNSNEISSERGTPLKKNTMHKEVEDLRSPESTSSEDSMVSSQAASSAVGEKGADPFSDCEIRWDDLLLGEEIGEGSYAVVYRGIWNGSDVAIKVYVGNEYREELLVEYKKEIAIMKRLRHPNVLLFMGAVYSPDRLAIVTELLARGSLFRALHKNNQTLDLRRRLRMALDVVRGMNYLHCRKPPIIHRDLKSSNLLVDKNWTVKVGDFGLSCMKESTVLTAKSGRGTPQWMAPEVLRGEFSDEKSDVYSFGVILWELMTESIPWAHLNPLQVVGVVGFMDQRLELPEGIDPNVSAIISDCWQSDPARRPSFHELVGRMGELLGLLRPPLPPGGRSSRQ